MSRPRQSVQRRQEIGSERAKVPRMVEKPKLIPMAHGILGCGKSVYGMLSFSKWDCQDRSWLLMRCFQLNDHWGNDEILLLQFRYGDACLLLLSFTDKEKQKPINSCVCHSPAMRINLSFRMLWESCTMTINRLIHSRRFEDVLRSILESTASCYIIADALTSVSKWRTREILCELLVEICGWSILGLPPSGNKHIQFKIY